MATQTGSNLASLVLVLVLLATTSPCSHAGIEVRALHSAVNLMYQGQDGFDYTLLQPKVLLDFNKARKVPVPGMLALDPLCLSPCADLCVWGVHAL